MRVILKIRITITTNTKSGTNDVDVVVVVASSVSIIPGGLVTADDLATGGAGDGAITVVGAVLIVGFGVNGQIGTEEDDTVERLLGVEILLNCFIYLF